MKERKNDGRFSLRRSVGVIPAYFSTKKKLVISTNAYTKFARMLSRGNDYCTFVLFCVTSRRFNPMNGRNEPRRTQRAV